MAKESYLRCDFSISVAALQEPLHNALHLAFGADRLLQNKFKSMLTVHKGKFRYIHIAQESIHKFVHIQIRAENFTHHGNMSHNNFDINAQKLMVCVCVCALMYVSEPPWSPHRLLPKWTSWWSTVSLQKLTSRLLRIANFHRRPIPLRSWPNTKSMDRSFRAPTLHAVTLRFGLLTSALFSSSTAI